MKAFCEIVLAINLAIEVGNIFRRASQS